jgi:uncharacterized protein YgbK (DUF1537 family)
MTGANNLLICFYGDDFTGSTASLEALAQAGVRTALFIETPTARQLDRYPALQAVGVAGMTRSMTPDAMEVELRPALAALKSLGAPHVHYKVCSTFDSSPTMGSIGKAIDLAAEMFRAKFVPLLVGMPALGRHCVFGNLFARCGNDGEFYRLDRHPSMSKHPSTPADESDLRVHLARQTAKSIGLFDILKLALPALKAQAALKAIVAEGPEVILFDVLYPEHLQRIGWLIDAYASRDRPLFSVGSSDVEVALAAHWTADGRLVPQGRTEGTENPWSDPGESKPLLVASGSCSPVTEKQIEWALGQGFGEVALDTAALAVEENVERVEQEATVAAVALLNARRGVIVHTSKGNQDARIGATAEVFARRGLDTIAARTLGGRLFGSALGRVMREVLKQTGARRLSVAGGDTSGYVARALGIEAVEMIGPIAPGAPLCRANAPGSPAEGLEVNFKGGQVGSLDYFGVVARGKP